MAARSRGRTRRGPRRRSSWVDLGIQVNAQDVAAAVISEAVLILPLQDEEAVTLVRIVGTVAMGLQASEIGTSQILMSWGIYIAASGSQGDLNMSPQSAVDAESEHWLHVKHMYENTGVASLAMNVNYEDNRVDVRVMRKVQEGDGIKIAFRCPVAYTRAFALRALVLHT